MLAELLFFPAGALAAKSRINEIIPVNARETDELCLFVTHAPAPALKQHVVDHVSSLIDENIAVVLIVNTSHPAGEFMLPADFSSRLAGLLIRQNVGFDFAAWGHAYGLLPAGVPRRRLYFVNDSIVGPLDRAAYRSLLGRIRRSGADMIGLTQNTMPRPHLQSFFLVFNEHLFRSQPFAKLMANVLNLPSKNAVIDVYEIQLTRYFQEHGFQCEALFPNMAQDDRRSNDTFYRWARLIEIGFPFVKAEVLRNAPAAADINRLVPAKYRRSHLGPPGSS